MVVVFSQIFVGKLNFLSFFLDRGFAFSQEKGQDRLVTDKLSDRVGFALLKKLEK